MKIKIQLRKLLHNQIRPTLRKVMEKWKEPKDVFAFVKIAEALDGVQKSYAETIKTLTDSMGIDIGSSKSINAEAIRDHLLAEFGKVGKDGKWTLEGVSDDDIKEFMEKKEAAEKAINAYDEAMEKILDEETEVEVLRLIKIKETDVKKELITANDVYLLLPFLDLSLVGGDEKPARDAEDDGEANAEV